MIRVAVAVIIDAQKRILITQRPLHTSHAGFWEFPGGKLEPKELPEQALIREVKEEAGVEVVNYTFLGEVNHQYPDKSVQLLVFLVTEFSGTPLCIEGQLAMKWMLHTEFNEKDFPEANREVMALIPESVYG